MKRFIPIILLFVGTLVAADFDGTWSGAFDVTGPTGETRRDRISMTLKQRGRAVTGHVGPDKSVQWRILNGKVEDGELSFEVRPPEGGYLLSVRASARWGPPQRPCTR